MSSSITMSTYLRETGGLMRPEYLYERANPASQSSTTNSSSQNPAIKTNRYFALNNLNGTNNANSNGNEVVNTVSKEARNFQKSLRKSPKGIFLNLEDLAKLAETDSDKLFDQHDKNIFFLKKQAQASRQDIDEMKRTLYGVQFGGNCSLVTDPETFDYTVSYNLTIN
jgi:hypothetical protein